MQVSLVFIEERFVRVFWLNIAATETFSDHIYSLVLWTSVPLFAASPILGF